ncbi:homeobox-leucine zipper HDG2-like isoform X1 [Olea europaea subsp. europaea]|uniref:Homeobox-leucine zipper HDG2-like isoform X1 n=1 Tax=Olea europaea subsp. europaea TaxID=158383 RepID=A0A8S0U6H4_OLEEU|nr:homeobox-leucine zipper HDG2-like isoform X1 [Olea europaea subsp. europaea]
MHKFVLAQTRHERQECSQLQLESGKLHAENLRYREALSNASCPTCGQTSSAQLYMDKNQLRMENARLKEELNRITSIASEYVKRPFSNYSTNISHRVRFNSLDMEAGTNEGTAIMGTDMYDAAEYHVAELVMTYVDGIDHRKGM